MTTWDHYRKTLIPMQLFIVAVCATSFCVLRLHVVAGVVLFLVMQLGAIGGAWWGARLTRRLASRRDRLPLER